MYREKNTLVIKYSQYRLSIHLKSIYESLILHFVTGLIKNCSEFKYFFCSMGHLKCTSVFTVIITRICTLEIIRLLPLMELGKIDQIPTLWQ